MSEEEIAIRELEVPELALEALDSASKRMRESGRPVVIVEGNQLIRIEGSESVVLRELPPLLTVVDRIKQATA